MSQQKSELMLSAISQPDFMRLLHSNQRLLVEELLRRGASVFLIDEAAELLQIEYKGRRELLQDRFTSAQPFTMVNISADKWLVKKLLKRESLPVPEGFIFNGNQVEDALRFADELGFPVVLKPNWGSHGHFVTPGINSSETLSNHIAEFISERGDKTNFLVEQHITGKEYRIFITSQGKYAVLHREPAHVIGDGKHTIADLAESETQRRLALKASEGTSLCPVAIDASVTHYLAQHNQTLDYIPQNQEKVYLRYTSNLAQGGVSIDATDEAHESVIAIAKRTLEIFKGLPNLGIDFISEDITISQDKAAHAIIEVNSSPGLAMHMQPAIGMSRNVASYLADVLFPE